MTGIFRVIYTDKREFLKFPITYNDVFNETFSGTFENIGAGQIFDRGGTIEIKSDGYGDLILPYTTVNNVLRVRSVYNYNDSFMGTHVFSYSDTVYTWYNSTTNNFIASLSLAYLDGFLSLSQATYLEQSDLVNAIHDLQVVNKNITFYPNPANNYITIRNTADIISIKIHDVKGILVKTIDIQNGNQQIDISDLNAGIYFIECYTKSYNYLEKLFVE